MDLARHAWLASSPYPLEQEKLGNWERHPVYDYLFRVTETYPQKVRQLDSILEEHMPGQQAELRDLMVKIKETNEASRALFTKLGFKQRGSVNYFGEVVLTMDWASLVTMGWWDGAEDDYRELQYTELKA